MLIPKKNRQAIYVALFTEGVLTCKKDLFLPKHQDLDVPNLHVRKLLQSLKSKGYVDEKFSWQWFYYSLTESGIEYLRQYLALPTDIVPATLKKSTKPQPRPQFGRAEGGGRGRGRGRGRGGFGGDREDYRGPKKFGDAPREFNPQFGEDGAAAGGGRGGRGGRGRGGFGGRGGGGRGRGGAAVGAAAPAAAPSDA